MRGALNTTTLRRHALQHLRTLNSTEPSYSPLSFWSRAVLLQPGALERFITLGSFNSST